MKKSILVVSCILSVLGAIESSALAGGCPSNCNGNGTCLVDNTCACFVGFVGVACDACGPNYYNYPTCTFCEASITCSGNGSCGPTGSCLCNSGYSGVNCEIGPPPVPTVSEWGLAILTLTGLIAGTRLFSRRKATAL